jgi:hypothetical protein
MRYDFGSVDDVDSFVSVPEGVYRCRVAEVREGVARDGSVRWGMRLEVCEGDYAGRTAAWDSLTWSDRGVYRVKKVFEALGLDVSGELEIEARDLVDLRAQVLIQPEEREDPLSGRRQVRMRVPYHGYAHEDGELAPRAGERAGRGAARGAGDDGLRGAGPRRDPESIAPVDGWGGGDE